MRLVALFGLQCCAVVTATGTCNIAPSDPQYDQFVSNASTHVKGWEVVDLDLPPRERWASIVAPHAQEIKEMLDVFRSSLGHLTKAFFRLSEIAFGSVVSKLVAALPQEYAEEIQGIQQATGINVVDLFVYNIMYELSGACTSIVAQASDGQILHGRNLDFGPEALSAKLRPILRNVRFVKGGKTVFIATTYLGYVGCLTCMKEGAFSISVDTRNWDSLPVALIEWITGFDRSGQFLAFLTRDAFMEDATFDAAVRRVNSTRLLGPAYVILGGAAAGEGAVITRSATESLHFWNLRDEVANYGRNYLLETNYDHWDGKPHDRRDDGRACMDHLIGAAPSGSIDRRGLFQVLSARPTRNQGTTYTTLMSSGRGGFFESYIQHCCDAEILV